ncbi:MAG: LacI family DNA-binding transcriptional regulator [Christensenellales bacterium]|nr:LacI family DNA-binding transcriptional regulator [Christensenellales bacterium]
MNIYDIAKEAGVSIATVSRVLNNKGTVSEATRAKVEEVLARSGYTPSAIARGMVSKSMRTVAVLTVDIRVPHYAQQAYTIEQAFSQRGYEVILCNTGGGKEATVHYLRAVTEKQVDGIILVGSVFNTLGREPEVEALLRQAPVVLSNGRLDIPNASSVLLDDAGGAALAVDHVVALGKRNLWYMLDLHTASALAKRDGFLKACQKYGDQIRGRVLETEFSIEGGRRAAKELLRSCRNFDAIICGEDETAVGVVKGLLGAGMRIPRDVAVTGYNNSVFAAMCEPRLTSVDNRPEQVALMCVQLLERMMDGEPGGVVEIFHPELAKGWTT